MKKENYLCLLLCIISCYCFAQSPVGDVNYYVSNLHLNSALSDEFNGSTVDLNKWKITHDIPNHWHSSNVSVSGGKLRIKYTEFDTVRYTGAIESIRWNYHYGYYETKYQLPYYIKPGTSQRSNKGIGQCYWLYSKVKEIQGIPHSYYMFSDEIDMYESYTIDSLPGHTNFFHNGIHILRHPASTAGWDFSHVQSGHAEGAWEHVVPADLTLIEHIYGFLYLPNEMRFYIDGVEQTGLRLTSNANSEHEYFPIHPMFLRFQGYVFNSFDKIDDDDVPVVAWPANPWNTNPEWVIDYVRYYELGLPGIEVITTLSGMNPYKIKPLNTPVNSMQGVENNVTIQGSNIVLPTHPILPSHVAPCDDEAHEYTRYYDPYNQNNPNYPNYLIRMAGKTIIKGTFKAPRGSHFQVVATPYSQAVPKMMSAESDEGSNDEQIMESNKQLMVYPNPVEDKVVVDYYETINAVEVYDSFGKLLQNIKGGNKTVSINMANYSKGLYLLKIYHDSGVITHKIMKQ